MKSVANKMQRPALLKSTWKLNAPSTIFATWKKNANKTRAVLCIGRCSPFHRKSVKHLTIPLLISIILIGCKSPNLQKVNINNDGLLDSLDYQLISHAIDQYLIHPASLSHRFESHDSLVDIERNSWRENIQTLLIIDSTYQHPNAISQAVRQMHQEIDDSDWDLSTKFTKVNSSYPSGKVALITCWLAP